MNAIFVCGAGEQVQRVYGPGQLHRLRELVDLPEEIIASADQLAGRDFSSVRYLFSTWGMLPLSEAEIRKDLPNLEAVFYAAGSVQQFARPFLNSGVRLYSAYRANAVPVAEYAFSQMLLSAKGYFRVQPLCRDDRHASHELFNRYPGNYGVRVGLLGIGAIGSLVAEMLKGTRLQVLAFDPFLSDERARALNVQKATLDEVFSTCLVVSNHLANLPETVGIIKREHLLSMPPYATFINTGRGPQLSETDLYDALTQDTTRTALLDVMTNEERSEESPLNALDNCLITPHIAGSSGNEVMRMADYMIDALEAYRNGAPSEHEVSMEMLATMA